MAVKLVEDTYCGECGGQYARDIAADDFDLANNRCM